MREHLALLVAATAFANLAGNAHAVTAEPRKSCFVENGELLPAESGGSDALCKAIAEATAEASPGMEYSVKITVLHQSRMSASITTRDGRRLPEQSFASMDRPLSSTSFVRFASAIAKELVRGKTAKY